jgi:hypothetical protein
MGESTDHQSPETSNDFRKIGKWARAYAQNRILGMVAMMVINLIIFLAIFVPSYFGGKAYRAYDWPIFWACMAIVIAAVAATVYISVPRWGGKLADRITKRLYAGEGSVQLTPPRTRGRMWVGGLLVAALAVGITTLVVLGFLDVFPEQYMQPVSAIYLVPFLVVLWLLMRPTIGPIFLLWPALYALHAVLILAGAPILFVGRLDSLNMLIPVFGYGLLVGLIVHVYSRFALARLRRTARGGLQDETAEEPQP